MDQQMGANIVEHSLTVVATASWEGQEKALVESLQWLDSQYSSIKNISTNDSSRGNLSNLHRDESLQWLLLQRLKVLQHLDRLHAVGFICNGRWDPVERELYVSLRDADIGAVARECAMVGEMESLIALLQCFPYSLTPQSLDILSATPETVDLGYIERVIRFLLDQHDPPELPRAKADWAECEESCSYLRQIGHANMLCTEHMAKLNYGWCSPQPSQIASWIVVRAFAIDRVTGMYDVAMKMLMIGIRLLGQEDAGPVVHTLLAAKAYKMLIELLSEVNVANGGKENMANLEAPVPQSMEDFALFNVQDRMECVMHAVMGQGVEHIMKLTNQYVAPYLEIENQIENNKNKGDSVTMDHLCSFLIKHGYSDMEWTFAFLSNEFSHLLIFESREEVANICYNIVYSPEAGCDTMSLEFQHRLVEIASLATSSESGSSRPVGHIQSRLSTALNMVTAAHELCKLGFPMNVRSVGDLKAETAIDYIKSLLLSKERQQVVQHEWSSIWDSLEVLFELNLVCFPRDAIVSEFCKASLRVGLIDLGREKLGLLPQTLAEEIVVETAQELILSGNSSKEKSVMIAKEILDLAPENDVAKKEKSFILAAIRLNELGIDVPPAQLRQSENSSQLFTTALRNVTSTKGLEDIDGVIGISASLQTKFSAIDVLELLGEIAMKFQDIDLCEKVASSLISRQKSKQACEVVKRIVLLGLHRENSKAKFLAFALSRISGDEMLELLESSMSDYDPQESLLDEILKANALSIKAAKDIPQFDRQNLFIQISMGLYYSSPSKMCDLVSEVIQMKDSLCPAIQYCCQTGGLAAISITILMFVLKSQTGKEQLGIDPFDLLHISLKDLCSLASVSLSIKAVDMNEELTDKFSSLLQNLGELLVASADENRVAILKDQDAYDLWATGDVDAQQNAIKQLTDRVAAKMVGKVGIIEGFESFGTHSNVSIDEEVTNQIHEISVLATRCDFPYHDIEKTYLSGVLYRHGASIAISKSWKSLVAADPILAIKHVIEIFTQAENFSNLEYCRLLEMMSIGFQSAKFDSRIHEINQEVYESSVSFSKDLEISMSVFLPLKPIVKAFEGIIRDVDVPAESEVGALKDYIALTSNIRTARAVFDYLKILSSSYTCLCAFQKQGTLCPGYPIRPELAIILAVSHYIVNLDIINGDILRSLLEKLDLSDLVEFAASVCLHVPEESLQFQDLQGPSTVPPGNLDTFINIVSTLIEHDPGVELSDAQKTWKTEIQKLSQEILLRDEIAKFDYLGEDAVTQAQEMIHDILFEPSSGKQIESTKKWIGDLMTAGYHFYPEVDFLIGLALPLVKDNKIERRGLLIDVLQNMMEGIINSFTKDTGSMSAGEGIQNIFGLVRCLDCNPPSILSSCLEECRSLVYSAICGYIIQHQGGIDLRSSEIYSQLVEMALALGKSKWDGWAPPEGEDQILTAESLVHSRFASFLSSGWPGALKEASISPDDLSEPEKVRQSMRALINTASETEQIELLWQAFSSIILPRYDSSASISSTLKIFLESLLEHGCFQSLLSALDIVTTRLGDSIPSELEEALLGSVSSNIPSSQAIKLLLDNQIDEEGNCTLSWGQVEQILSDDQNGLLREATVVLIIRRSLAAKLFSHDARLFMKMCEFLFEGDISLQSASYLSGDKEVLVPHGIMLAVHLIEQLLAANQLDGAAWIAYKQLLLVSNLRVKDSRIPSILAVLKPVASMQPRDSQDDLEVNIDNFPVIESFKGLLFTSRDSAEKALALL